MSGDWELRPAGPDDLEALVEVYRAEDLKYRGRSELDLDAFNERLAADPNFDAAQDQVIAELDGSVVGAAIIRPSGAFLAVHPDHDVPGLRASVLSWVQWRQAQMGRSKYLLSVPAATTPTVALLRRAGWELDRFYVEMTRDFALTGAPEAEAVPSGYRLRAVDPVADAAGLYDLNERAFGERPDHLVRTPEAYARAHLSTSAFAAEWSVLAETENGAMAGSVIGSRRPGQAGGYISLVGVDPGHRRRGLARTLLLAAMGAIHAAGRPSAALHVASDNDSALDLYRGVGMDAGERIEHYGRRP